MTRNLYIFITVIKKNYYNILDLESYIIFNVVCLVLKVLNTHVSQPLNELIHGKTFEEQNLELEAIVMHLKA